MIKLFLWDFNGVIIADAKDCYEADLAIVLHFGGRHFSFKEWQRAIIIPSDAFYASMGCPLEELHKRGQEVGYVFDKIYEPRVKLCRTRKGLRETLLFLRSQKIGSVICSNHTVSGIEALLRRFKLITQFSAILANDSISTSMFKATKSERIKKHLAKLNLKPHEVMIVGDSPEEVKIGKHEGFITVGAMGGYYDDARIKLSKPDHYINRISELILIVKQYR